MHAEECEKQTAKWARSTMEDGVSAARALASSVQTEEGGIARRQQVLEGCGCQ